MRQIKTTYIAFVILLIALLTGIFKSSISQTRESNHNLNSINQRLDSFPGETLKLFPVDDIWITTLNSTKKEPGYRYGVSKNEIVSEHFDNQDSEKKYREISDAILYHRPSFGLGLFCGISYQSYDGNIQRYLKRVTTFSIDIDAMYNRFMFTLGGAWGGGKLYDTLNCNNWDWLPVSKISTSNYKLLLGYSIKDNNWLKVTPFAGLQNMRIKYKPEYHSNPPGKDNLLISNGVYTFGIHLELKLHVDAYKYITGTGARFTYAYSKVNFPDISGYMHQLTVNIGFLVRENKSKPVSTNQFNEQ